MIPRIRGKVGQVAEGPPEVISEVLRLREALTAADNTAKFWESELSRVEKLSEEMIAKQHESWESLYDENTKLREALERIAKKAPEKVSREEAADMACEFVLVARQALEGEK